MKKKKLNQLQLKKATISHLSKDAVRGGQLTRQDQGLIPSIVIQCSFDCHTQLLCPSVLCPPTFDDCPLPTEFCDTLRCSPTSSF